MKPPSYKTVRVVVAATVLITLFHFTDNIVNVDTYPRQEWLSGTLIQVAGVLFWPFMVAVGIAGYRFYRRGSFEQAHAYLTAFSFIGLVSLGHFTAGSPGDLTTRGLVSVTVDGICGFAVLGLVAWSVLARRRGRAGEQSPTAQAG